MSDDSYRGALTAAQSRIESLEREVQAARAALPPPAKGTPAWVQVLAWLGGLGVAVFLLGTVGTVVFTTLMIPRDPQLPESYPSMPVVAPKPTLGATWYTAGRDEPQVVADLDGDGKKDLVSLFWSAPDDTPLYVAAISRETLESIWVAGPYPSQWAGSQTHLVVSDGHVVVADSRETLHVLELRTGNELTTLPIPGGADRLCVRAKNPRQVLVSRNYTNFSVLDLDTQQLAKQASNEVNDCLEPRPDCTATRPTTPCFVAGDSVPKRLRPKGFSSYGALRWGDTLLARGARVVAENEPSTPWLAVSSAKDRQLRWTSPSVVDGDVLHLATSTNDALTATAVISFYQRSTGDFRLVARDNEKGEVLWNVAVGATKEGSYASMYILDGDVFVFADHRMYAYDLETGVARRSSSGI